MGKTIAKLKIKPSLKYKMSREELQSHLNEMRRGASVTKNGRAYSRKQKYKGAY